MAVLDVKAYIEYLLETTTILDDYAFNLADFEADKDSITYVDLGLATDGAEETTHRSMVLTFLRFVAGPLNAKLHAREKQSNKEKERRAAMGDNDAYWLGVQSHLNCVLVAYSTQEDTPETNKKLIGKLYGLMEELFGGDEPFMYCKRLEKYVAFRFAFPADHKAHQMHLGCGGASHISWFFSPNNAVTCPEKLTRRWRYCADCMRKPLADRKRYGCSHMDFITSKVEATLIDTDPLILRPFSALNDLEEVELDALLSRLNISPTQVSTAGSPKQALLDYIHKYDSMSYEDLAKLGNGKTGHALREDERILDRILLSYKVVTKEVFTQADKSKSFGLTIAQLSSAWNELEAADPVDGSRHLDAFQLLNPLDTSHINKKKMIVMYFR